jgi:hypothetical protein
MSTALPDLQVHMSKNHYKTVILSPIGRYLSDLFPEKAERMIFQAIRNTDT